MQAGVEQDLFATLMSQGFGRPGSPLVPNTVPAPSELQDDEFEELADLVGGAGQPSNQPRGMTAGLRLNSSVIDDGLRSPGPRPTTPALSLPGTVTSPMNGFNKTVDTALAVCGTPQSSNTGTLTHTDSNTSVKLYVNGSRRAGCLNEDEMEAIDAICAKKTEKFKNDRRRADEYISAQGRREAELFESRLQRMVSSKTFELICAAIILLNSFFIGLQLQVMTIRSKRDAEAGRTPDTTVPDGVVLLQGIFVVLFALEVGLRWSAEGRIQYFTTREAPWNIFDALVLLVALSEFFVEVSARRKGVFGRSMSLLRMLRVMRLVRILRVVRIARFFKELRLMLSAILGSLQSLVWVLVVFLLIFFSFGVAFQGVVVDFCNTDNRWEDDGVSDMIRMFGSIDRSMLSLFAAMTGGLDWLEVYEALDLLPQLKALFLLYIAFAFFAAVNVVTGVFVEGALRSSESDREYLIQEEMEAKAIYINQMQALFEEMDTNGFGTLSLDEFEAHMDDERAIAYFNALKIDFSEARTLFSLLDVDQSGQIDFQEFLAGCDKLSGEARSMDLAMLHYEVRWLTRSFLNFEEFVQSNAIGRSLAEHLDTSGNSKNLPAWVRAAKQMDRSPTNRGISAFPGGFS